MKIVFHNVAASEEARIRERLTAHTVTFLHTDTSLAQLKDAVVLSVFIDTKLTSEMLHALPSLKLIATRSTGFDHIDIKAARECGITVSTVPRYGVRTVAEFSFALILALSRKASAAHVRLRSSHDTDVATFEGFDLYQKTIGVVGTGNIGQNTARIAKGFGMRIMLYDAYPNEAFAAEIGAPYVGLNTLVAESDIVSLHIPYLPSTHHLVNGELLKKFKRGSYLINTARGGVVDTPALLTALKDGTLAGAGLDVVEGEDDYASPHIQELLSMEQVILTPHIAFDSKEANSEILETTLDDISSYIAGTPKNDVTKI